MKFPRWTRPWLLIAWVALLAFFFAEAEIQIEGGGGWAANLPTWRIEQHWLLDIFWGGRPLTGYHAWVFSFMGLMFHLPVFAFGRWSWRIEARLVALIMLFWVIEDLLWFVLNPAFGWRRLSPVHVAWHRYWWLGLPADYWLSTIVGAALFTASYRKGRGDK